MVRGFSFCSLVLVFLGVVSISSLPLRFPAVTTVRSSAIGGGSSSINGAVPKSPQPSSQFNEKLAVLTDQDDFSSYLQQRALHRTLLTSPEKNVLAKELLRRLPDMHHKNVAMCLWSLGTLKLPSRSNSGVLMVMDVLLERLDMSRNELNATDMALGLVGLAKLGVVIRPVKDSFLDALPACLPNMDAKQTASVVWALGKIGIGWDDLSMKTRKAIGEAVVKNSADSPAHSVAITIFGLSMLRTKWNLLPAHVIKALTTSLQRTVHKMDAQEVGDSFSGLGRLGADWYSLPASSRKGLGRALLRSLALLDAEGLAMCLHGLGRMNADIASLPPSFRISIMSAITRVSATVSEEAVSNLMYGLGKMGCTLLPDEEKSESGMSRRARQMLMAAFAREGWKMTAKGVADSCWGLMLMDAKWSSLPSLTRVTIIKSVLRMAGKMNEQQISNVIYSLAKFGLDESDVPKEAQQELFRTLELQQHHMSPAGTIMSLRGLGRLGFSWKNLPEGLREAISESVARVLRTASDRSVTSLVHGLAMIGASWKDLARRSNLQVLIQESIARSHWELHKQQLVSGSGKHSSSGDIAPDFSTCTKATMSTSSLLQMEPNRAAAMLLLSTQAQATHSPQAVEAIVEMNMTTSLPTTTTTTTTTASLTDRGDAPHDAQGEEGREHAVVAEGVNSSTTITNKNSSTQAKKQRSSKRKLTSLVKNADIFDQFDELLNTQEDNSGVNDGHLVHSLGLLGAYWDDLGFSTRSSLSNSLVHAMKSMKEKGVVNSLQGLAGLGARWQDLRHDVKNELQASLRRVAQDMQEEGVSSVILSLARMEVCWCDDLDESTQVLLRKAIIRQARLSELSLSNLLFGLGKMRKWADLHPQVRHSLKEAIVVCHLGDKCTAKGVSNSLSGLAQMEAKWSSLSSSVHLSLLSEISAVLPDASEEELSTIIESLGKMDAAQIPTNLRKSLLLRLEDKLQSLSELKISSILNSLSSLGLKWDDLPTSLCRALLDRLTQVIMQRLNDRRDSSADSNLEVNVEEDDDGEAIKHCNVSEDEGPRALADTIVGLGRLEASWTMFPISLVEKLEESVHSLVKSMDGSQIASVFCGLSKIGFRWDSLGEKAKSELLSALTDVYSSLSEVSVAIIMHALGQIGINWKRDLPLDTRKLLLTGLGKVARDEGGSALEMASVVYGMGLMDCSWEKLNQKARNDIVFGILRVASTPPSPSASSFASTPSLFSTVDMERLGEKAIKSIWFLGVEIRKNQKASILQKMCPQAQAKLMYAVALLVFDANDKIKATHELANVHQALLESFAAIGSVGSYSEKEKEQINVYVYLLQDLIPEAHKHARFILLRTDMAQPHCPEQIEVCASLAESIRSRNTILSTHKRWTVETSFSPFGGAFPADVVVMSEEDGGKPLLFVEVDDETHLTTCGDLKRASLLKEQLYRARFPGASFTRVPADAISILGSHFVSEELGNYLTIVQSHHQRSGSLSANSNIYDYNNHSDALALRLGARELSRALSLKSNLTGKQRRRHSAYWLGDDV